MSISVDVAQENDYLFMKAKGVYSFSDFHTLADRVAAESLENNRTNILVDISEVVGNIPFMDQFLLGEYVSEIWKHPIRVAIICRDKNIYKFFENVAVNRATQTIVVPDIQSALEWLIEKTPNTLEADDGR